MYQQKIQKVNKIKNATIDDLSRNENMIRKKIEYKEEKAKKEFDQKMTILKSNFNQNIGKLVDNIETQREIISTGYGPLVLDSKKEEKPIFEINKEIDPEGFKKQKYLNKMQNEVPGILNINILQCRCLKDKISPGYFIVKVKVLSRIGEAKMEFDMEDCHEEYKELSKDLRYFSKKKRAYLDKEHREMDVKGEDGKIITKAAVATGLNFFKA